MHATRLVEEYSALVRAAVAEVRPAGEQAVGRDSS